MEGAVADRRKGGCAGGSGQRGVALWLRDGRRAEGSTERSSGGGGGDRNSDGAAATFFLSFSVSVSLFLSLFCSVFGVSVSCFSFLFAGLLMFSGG